MQPSLEDIARDHARKTKKPYRTVLKELKAAAKVIEQFQQLKKIEMIFKRMDMMGEMKGKSVN